MVVCQWRTQDLKGEGAGGEGDVPPPAGSAGAFENVNSVC